MILGILSNVCGYAAGKLFIKGVIGGVKYGIDILDKVAVPIGVEIFSWMAADEAATYVKGKAKEIKEVRAEVRAIAEERREQALTKHNVFDENGGNEDGESGNA